MASGCPVVGSDVGGIPFVVRDGVDGLLVPPGDADALADALGAVLTDDVRAEELGRAGREAALERWDWARQEDRTVRVVEQAARRGGNRVTA
jgi:glycosyltransferase involved in cell wall biosynthesis